MVRPSERLVRWAIRLLLPVLTLGGAGSIAGLVFQSVGWERTIDGYDSPRHKYRAEIVTIASSAEICGPRGTVLVRVVRRYGPLRGPETAVFCLQGPGTVSVRWLNATRLEVDCSRCDRYSVRTENWSDLHFAFDLDRM